MELVTLGSTAVKFAVQAASLVSKSVMPKAQQRTIERDAASMVAAEGAVTFLEHLPAKPREIFADFAASPQFDAVVRQAMILAVSGAKRDKEGAVREQLRHGLRHRGFPGEDLLQGTDVLEELVHATVHAVRRSSTVGTLDSGRATVTAARVATAAARNGELLAGP